MSTIHQSGSTKWKKIKKKHFNCLRSLNNCPQKKGVVSKIRVVSPKKPNSARRKVARVRLSNNLFITAKIRGQGHNLQSYSTVLICGGRANDVPGVRYNIIKGVLDFNWKEDYRRNKSRSKYGISLEDFLQYA